MPKKTRERRAAAVIRTPDGAEPVASGSDACSIVGIGASAGGLEAVSQLLAHLPPGIRMALVIVQHLDPTHESNLASLLTHHSKLPVVQAHHGQEIEPSRVYVIPPNSNMAISQRRLMLTRRGAHERHMPIDVFFSSLAHEHKGNAMGVILSGTASDGTLGLRAIKAEGGITFAQDGSAQFDGMPRSAIAAGVVDFILSPEGIARELTLAASHPYFLLPEFGHVPEAILGEGSEFLRLMKLLRDATGVDFTHYKQPTIQRRLMRRLVLHRMEKLGEYLTLLQKDPAETGMLFNDLLVHVTEFFRDAQVFEALQRVAFPAILQDRRPGEAIRVWVPGCSTGEEAYSIAMCLMECLEAAGVSHPLQVFGTEIHEEAIEKARAGLYADALMGGVSPERQRRFFLRQGSGFQVARFLRDKCVFSRQNVVKDPPLSRMDLISCRNLLIYLSPILQKKVLATFAYALRPGGCLLLGTSETLGSLSDHFIAIDREHKIYRCSHPLPYTEADLLPRMALATFVAPVAPAHTPAPAQTLEGAGVPGQKYIDRLLLERYAPPGLVVDKNLVIVQFRGAVGPYLAPTAGEASLELTEMIREELILPVKVAIEEARRQKAAILRLGVPIRDSNELSEINVVVVPLDVPRLESHLLILFESATRTRTVLEAQGETLRGLEQAPASPRQVAQLEAELSSSRMYLQSIIEELRSANEEIQSSNEELQSTNEELQTTKEELQSTNEELRTLNTEMESRNAELTVAHDDLFNLLSSMHVPVLMLGNDLRIRRFTPMAEKVLNLIATDVGRPVSDLKPRINVENLEEVLLGVIQTLAIHTQEVRDQEGRWWLMRVRPYRTADNRIDGVVLQLVDIDQLRRSVEEIKHARDYAEAIVDTVREPLLVLDSGLRVMTANRAFYQIFRVSHEETAGQSIFELGGGQWNFPAVRQLLETHVPHGDRVEDLEIEHAFERIGWKTLLLNARRIRGNSDTGLILLAIEDITDRKRMAEARYRRLFEAAKDGILIVNPATGQITDVNPFAVELFGYTREELLGKALWEAEPLRRVPDIRGVVDQICAEEIVRSSELTLATKQGKELQIEIVGNAYSEDGRKLVQLNIRDVTERKRFERQLQHTQKLESVGLLAGGIAHDFNNLLTGILGNAMLALADLPNDVPVRQYIRDVISASERASDLTRQLLAYAGKGRFVMEPLGVSELAREIQALIHTSIPKTVTVELALAGDLPWIEADPSQIQQLIMNLVINGAEAIGEGQAGTVTVRTRRRTLTAVMAETEFSGDAIPSGEYVSLEVQDTGCGMDEATKGRIFDPFFTTKFTGRGLGLAAAQGIVRAHKGVMRVWSAPGMGSSFEVLFPAVVNPASPRLETSGARDFRGAGTVLLIDDEATVRLFAERTLKRFGYTVVSAANGEIGIQLFAERKDEIHLVILDLSMPVMDGRATLEQLRGIRVDVPVILTSGYDEAETTRRIGGTRLAGFLHKPFGIHKLMEAVSEALKRRVGEAR